MAEKNLVWQRLEFIHGVSELGVTNFQSFERSRNNSFPTEAYQHIPRSVRLIGNGQNPLYWRESGILACIGLVSTGDEEVPARVITNNPSIENADSVSIEVQGRPHWFSLEPVTYVPDRRFADLCSYVGMGLNTLSAAPGSPGSLTIHHRLNVDSLDHNKYLPMFPNLDIGDRNLSYFRTPR